MLKSYVLCCVLTVLTPFGNAARILAIVPTPSYSHQVVFQPIWKELSLRGHRVTTITTDPIKDPSLVNLTEIDLHFFYEFDYVNNTIRNMINSGPFTILSAVLDGYEIVSHRLLSHKEVQELVKNKKTEFDVVMIELGFLPMFAFARMFNAPLIVVTSMDAPSNLRSLVGSPTHPIAYPDAFLPVKDTPSIYDRLLLVGYSVFMEILRNTVIIPSQQLLVEKYFGPHYPSARELQNDVSLVLTYCDPVLHGIKPLVPTVVQFGGGIHRSAPKPLPKELKASLDAAENGFIYFSLGSNVRSEDLSKETRNAIVETFAELPYIVLWKFEGENFQNKPENLITSKWFSQQDILKHPNIKLFITQGGLQSMDEAIYDHVPMIGMPFMSDQRFNINNMVRKGLGLSIDYKTLRKDKFKATILEVINNPKYRKQIKEIAGLALDQPMTGLEKAVWWTEYVIRHNGTKHLKSPLIDMPFYQYYYVDVAAIIMLVLIVFLSLVVFVFKLLHKLLRMCSSNKKIKNS